MPTVRHYRGTRAAFVALAGAGTLLPGQIYILTDESRIAVALTTTTYDTFAKESESNNASGLQVNGTALGTTGAVNLNLATLSGTLQKITATGNITFTTSNRVAGRRLELRIAAGASARTLTWPAWVAFGAALPTALASGKTLRVTLSCTGTTDASIDAAAAVTP